MNLRLRPLSVCFTLSLLLAANTVAAAPSVYRVRIPLGTPKIASSPPVLELSGVGSSLDFGQVQVAQQVESNTLVVSNKGKVPATAFDVYAPAGFEVVGSNCGAELKPGSSCSFAVTFSPTQSRAYSGSVIAESANGSSVQLHVEGTGLGAAMELSGINFGDMMDGTSQVQTAELRNTGVGSVRLYAPRVSGPGFTLAAGSTCGAVLAARASCHVNVGLIAAGVMAHAGMLSVPTMDAGELQAPLSAQSRHTYSVNTTVTTSGSVSLPAGVASVTLIGKGGDGYDDSWYDPGQPYIEGTPGQPYIAATLGQPYIAATPGQPYIAPNPGQPYISATPGQPEVKGQPYIEDRFDYFWKDVGYSFSDSYASPPSGYPSSPDPYIPPGKPTAANQTWNSQVWLLKSGPSWYLVVSNFAADYTVRPGQPYIAYQPAIPGDPGQQYIAPSPGQAYVAPNPGQAYIAPNPGQAYIAPTPSQLYIAPSSGGGPKYGVNSTATVGGSNYTFTGGFGGAASTLTYSKSLSGGAQTLTYAIAAGGSLNYQYSYTLPY